MLSNEIMLFPEDDVISLLLLVIAKLQCLYLAISKIINIVESGLFIEIK